MIFQIKIKNKLESALENTLGGQGQTANTKDEFGASEAIFEINNLFIS